MKKYFLLTAFLIVNVELIIAQQTGVVIDETTEKTIPYVNIHIAGTTTGFTTNKKGFFSIFANQEDTAVFSAVGYNEKRLPVKLIGKEVTLSQRIYEMPEVIIHADKKIFVKIGELKRQFPSYHYGLGNTIKSAMIARLFPYQEKFRETPFLKSIEFLTHSDVNGAKFNIRLYRVDSRGGVGEPLYHKNIIATAHKGSRKTKVEMDALNLAFPITGLIVATEWLNIEENKFEYTYTKSGSKKKYKAISLEPSFSIHKDKRKLITWSYWGSWHRNNVPIQMEIMLEN